VRRFLLPIVFFALLGAAPAAAHPTVRPGVPFKRVASGISYYQGSLQQPQGFIAASRAATRPFLWLLRPRDQASVKAVDFHRWALLAVVEAVDTPGWSVKIGGVSRDGLLAHTAVSLTEPPPNATCACDPGPYYSYDVVKVRKTALQRPLPASVLLEWQTAPPAKAFVGAGQYLLAYGASCWFWLGSGSCSITVPYALIAGVPRIDVSAAGSVGFDFRFDAQTVTLTLLDQSSQPTETIGLPVGVPSFSSARAVWNVPAGFSTTPDGVLAVVHASGDQGDVDYIARLVTASGTPAPHVMPVWSTSPPNRTR
jgi:hypothetical protein